MSDITSGDAVILPDGREGILGGINKGLCVGVVRVMDGENVQDCLIESLDRLRPSQVKS